MKKDIGSKINNSHNLNERLILDGLIIGLVAGLSSISYRFMLSKLEKIRFILFNDIDSIIVILIFLILIGYIVGKLVKWEPLSSGSGIPQVQAELMGKVDMNSFKLIFSKFLGGGLSSLAGLSLGREGPSIQIGAAVSKMVARLMNKDNTEERYMITAGASAGLSAAFNAPISGTLFALEELHKNFSSLVLIPCIIASVVADFISKNVFGLKPAFSFKVIEQIPLNQYYHLVILGLFAGIIGVVFNKTLLFSQDIFKKINIKLEYKTIIIMLLSAVVAYFSYDLLGGGHHLLEEIAVSGFSIKILIFYIVGKLLFTTFSYGSNAPGGIFLPVLVIGGLVGSIYFNIFGFLIGISDIYYTNFIICGMAAIMTAVIRAPIISILLVSEMTGSFQYILGLCLVSIIAYLIAELFNNEPIYDSLLSRFLDEEGKEEVFMGEKTLINFKIPLIANILGIKLADIQWPCKMLIVSIKRDGKEIVPDGNSQLEPGDDIQVLVDYKNIACVKTYFKIE